MQYQNGLVRNQLPPLMVNSGETDLKKNISKTYPKESLNNVTRK